VLYDTHLSIKHDGKHHTNTEVKKIYYMKTTQETVSIYLNLKFYESHQTKQKSKTKGLE